MKAVCAKRSVDNIKKGPGPGPFLIVESVASRSGERRGRPRMLFLDDDPSLHRRMDGAVVRVLPGIGKRDFHIPTLSESFGVERSLSRPGRGVRDAVPVDKEHRISGLDCQTRRREGEIRNDDLVLSRSRRRSRPHQQTQADRRHSHQSQDEPLISHLPLAPDRRFRFQEAVGHLVGAASFRERFKGDFIPRLARINPAGKQFASPDERGDSSGRVRP